MPGGFGALSSVYPGYQAAETTSLDNEKTRLAAEEAQNKLLGAQALGRAIFGIQGPQQPQGGQPMAPPPGQPSMPRPQMPMGAPPGAPPQMPGTPMAAPPQAPQAAGPAPQGPIQEVNLQTVAQRILQANPGIAQKPAVMLAALERASPILDRQSKEDLAELRKEYQGQVLQARTEALKAREAGLNERTATREAGQNQRATDRNVRTDRRLDQADTKEQRLAAAAGVRQDQGWQRLDIQRQQLEQRIQQGGDRAALAQWRAVLDAQHKRATEILQANSVNTDMKPADRKALLDEQRAAYDTAIEGMRSKMGATTPTGGTTAPGAPAQPKTESALPTSKPIPFDVRQQYDAAIAAGKPKDALVKRLQEQGYKTDGL